MNAHASGSGAHLPLRIAGLVPERIPDPRREPTARLAALYAALDHRYELTGVAHAVLPRPLHYLNRALTYRPDRVAWGRYASLNVRAFKWRSVEAGRQLNALNGQFDLILQQLGLCMPSLDLTRWPYALYLDNTYAISEAQHPEWAPLRGRERQQWLDYERDLYQHARCIFTMGLPARQSVIEQYGVESSRVVRVGAGANMIAESLGERSYDTQKVIFVGNDFERKGGSILLNAWHHIHARFPTAILQIVGPRDAYPDLPPNVQWIGRVNSRAQLSQLYSQASLFVLPSFFEPWGFVFHEAMGHGVPVVGANCCAMPEIIEEGVTGHLVPPGDAEALAEAISRRLANPDESAVMGRAAHQVVQQMYTWEAVVSRMAPALETCL